MPIQVVVPIIVILSMITNIAILYNIGSFADLRKIWLLIVSSLAAAPFGTYVLLAVNESVLKAVTGGIIVVFGVVMLAGISFPVKSERAALVPVGITSGLLNGSISLSGPPVVLFLSNQGVEKQTFRANMSAYGILLNMVTLAGFAYGGLLSGEVMKFAAWFIPAMIVGVIGGIFASRHLNERKFRKIALGLIVISGIWTVVSAV